MGSEVDVLTTVVSKALVSYLLKVLVLVAVLGCLSLPIFLFASQVSVTFSLFTKQLSLCALLTRPRGLLSSVCVDLFYWRSHL